jgi:hypothetical protein
MRTHHDPATGILTATCSPEEFAHLQNANLPGAIHLPPRPSLPPSLILLQNAHLPGDIQGAALLAELKCQQEDLHSRGFRVQVELCVEAPES